MQSDGAVVGDGLLLEPQSLLPGNYLPEACIGCIIVHKSHPLVIGTGVAAGGGESYQLDVNTNVFSVVNSTSHPCFTYVSFLGMDVRDKHHDLFQMGTTRSEHGIERSAITFVVVAEPHTAIRLCRVDTAGGLHPPPIPRAWSSALHSPFVASIEMERLLPPPPIPRAWSSASVDGAPDSCPMFGFPLADDFGPFLCTQGVGGHLTHFFPESYHAIDLRCSCGTPVLSIGNGVIREVAEANHCGGIHAANLAAWNSVSVHLECGLIVEYLHTLPGSARFKVGDEVRLGDVICESGDIGFAPEPHLHIEAHVASDPDGPSVPLIFSGSNGGRFVPVAGRWYCGAGQVARPAQPASGDAAGGNTDVASQVGGLVASLEVVQIGGEGIPGKASATGELGRDSHAVSTLLEQRSSCCCMAFQRKLSRDACNSRAGLVVGLCCG